MTVPESTPVTPGLAELPEPVRAAIIGLAAGALDRIRPEFLPVQLIKIARFAKAKRAKVAAVELQRALTGDTAFRTMVASTITEPRTDDIGILAMAYLAGKDLDEAALARVSLVADLAAARARISELERRRPTTTPVPVPPEADDDQVARLTARLRQQGVKLRQAREAAAAATARLQTEHEQLRAECQQWRDQAEQAHRRAEAALAQEQAALAALAQLRAEVGRGQQAVERRTDLLLTAISQAAAGLRRELDPSAAGPLPADVLAAQWPQPGDRGQTLATAGHIVDYLAIPGLHLLVDGYNVTKTGYPELSLADQRDRLVRSLAALCAQTSAEITVVFDGAGVVTPAPQRRGIRVLFSPPQVTADDVLRRLIAAEPAGRMQLVITSDREIIADVLAAGAYTASSALFLGVLSR